MHKESPMDAMDAILTRGNIQKYKPEHVSEKLITEILEAEVRR